MDKLNKNEKDVTDRLKQRESEEAKLTPGKSEESFLGDKFRLAVGL